MVVPAAFGLALVLLQSPYPGDPPQLEESRALLEAGEPFDALDAAEVGLEYAPDHVGLLIAAARAAEAGNEADAALWYAGLALTRATGVPGYEQAEEELRLNLAELDPLEGASAALFDAYAGEVLELGRTLYRAKLYLNAVDMYARCEGTVTAAAAGEQLGRVYENARAVEALLEAGSDVPVEPPRKRSAQWIAKHDREHASWEERAEFEGEYYTVETNMGYELGEQILAAMEQMNQLYREVFQYKVRGGSMARCRVYVYKHRSEYFEHNPDAEENGWAGHYSPSTNSVYTYDQRTNPWPQTLDDLWVTLFHEASHQFTHVVSKHPMPTWLNEGTASYFEGARLLPNGTVRTNLVPESRLRWAVRALGRDDPSLEQLVRHFEPGSYPGEYYPVGWALVYFLHNWEDADCERPYVEAYRDYLEAYTTGGKHDPHERFVEYFVERPEVPGVESFEDFARRVAEWINELHELQFGTEEMIDVLLQRAANQAAHEKWSAAAETYRRALDRRPRDARACFGLAEVLEEQKQKDAAIINYRRTLEIARDAADPGSPLPNFEQSAGELSALCLERITKLHRTLGVRMTESDEAFAARAAQTAAAYVEADFPRNALRLLSDSIEILGGHGGLREQMDAIGEETGFDMRRWRRLPITPELESWWADEEDWAYADGALVGTATKNPHFAFFDERLPEEYLLEITLAVEQLGRTGTLGVVYGPRSSKGMHLVMVGPRYDVVAGIYSKDGFEVLERLTSIPPDDRSSFTIGVRYGASEVELLVDGHSHATLELAPGEIEGAPALLVQDAVVRFSDARVMY